MTTGSGQGSGATTQTEWVVVNVQRGTERLTGHLALGEGQVGFIVCDWDVAVGDSLELVVMADGEAEAGIQLKGDVRSIAAASQTEFGRPGISMGWREVLTSESPYSLKRFLRDLGVEHVQIDATGDALFAYRHRFPDFNEAVAVTDDVSPAPPETSIADAAVQPSEVAAPAVVDPWDEEEFDVAGADLHSEATMVTNVLPESFGVAASRVAEEPLTAAELSAEATVVTALLPVSGSMEALPVGSEEPEGLPSVATVVTPVVSDVISSGLGELSLEATVVTAVLPEPEAAVEAVRAKVDPWDEDIPSASETATVVSRVLSESELHAAAEAAGAEALDQYDATSEATVVTRTLSESDLLQPADSPAADPWGEVEATSEVTVMTAIVPEPATSDPVEDSEEELPMLFRRRMGSSSGRRQVYDESTSGEQASEPFSQAPPPAAPTAPVVSEELVSEPAAQMESDSAEHDAVLTAPEPEELPPSGEEVSSPEDAPEMASWIRGVHPERRERERVSVSVPVTFLVGSVPSGGRVHNISRAGCLVETPGQLPVLGTRMNIRLPVARNGKYHMVMLTTKVVRYAPEIGGFAVKHSQIDELGEKGLFVQFLFSHQG